MGDPLGLTGTQEGEALAVTVVKVVDPAGAENEFSTPEAGERFVAVQFRLQNTGTAVCSDSPSNGARLVDAQGRQFGSSFTTPPPAPASLGA
ncbi:DUF4352 domain-containing protein [Streptomyces sp. HMX87]|uniref:DUF4352 domain-containing protein n=1 Tax=Streptomyces sp. HMX87 TaxID=3390849 RepID=UPI003A850582